MESPSSIPYISLRRLSYIPGIKVKRVFSAHLIGLKLEVFVYISILERSLLVAARHRVVLVVDLWELVTRAALSGIAIVGSQTVISVAILDTDVSGIVVGEAWEGIRRWVSLSPRIANFYHFDLLVIWLFFKLLQILLSVD